MRTSWRDVTVDAIDYEIVRISEHSFAPEVGAFSDVFVSEGRPWRLVAGYLMLTSRADAGTLPSESLEVYSHGRAVARLELSDATATWSLVTRSDASASWLEDGGSLRASGIALVPEGQTPWDIEEGTVSIDRATPWAITVVHGPAESKVETRVRLLASLQAVGGRRG